MDTCDSILGHNPQQIAQVMTSQEIPVAEREKRRCRYRVEKLPVIFCIYKIETSTFYRYRI